MTLVELVESARALGSHPGLPQTPVTSVTHDSRAVAAGSVFVAVQGRKTDGARFAAEAEQRGAAAIVAETPRPDGVTVPWLVVPDARLALSELAAVFYGHPSRVLTVVGMTGTNGKTTSTYLMASIFDAASMPCGRMSTTTIRISPGAGGERDAAHTTPEASDVQRLLREMQAAGCRACAMEVSSHALVLHRVAHVNFSAAIFTNLTRDHLDFHRDMQDYFAAKRRLFEMLPAGAPAAINIDDPRGAELAAGRSSVLTYAIDRPADVRARNVHSTLEGLAFEADTPRGPVAIRSPLVGRPNVYNILGVVAAATGLEIPIAAIEAGIARLERVPGRFQVVSGSADDVRVVVDYAHTDDALKNLLEMARPLSQGRLVTVFGCGGDRDRTKRPLMGAVAARLSDYVIITSDNPRTEDPVRILDEIKLGLAPSPEPGAPQRAATPWVAEVDRRRAIEQAVRNARPGDLVVIAGKGHEKYQIIGDRTLAFDDVEVAQTALAERRGARRM
jgi:UDP-N-acetylmuramoyl-L-alanyl-D-glutamate--2,6-diaminopimelate ligase